MITGQFKSTKGNIYKVNIDCDTTGELILSDDPITITQDIDDTFTHIIKTTASISLQIKEYIGDNVFTANDREVPVKIYKGDTCIFDGYVEPQTYNQDFTTEYNELELNCNDYLCTLENHKYREKTDYSAVKASADDVSFEYILSQIFGTERKVYYDDSIKYSLDDKSEYLFKNSGISEMMLLGDEEDDLWTDEDVLTEILQYFNLHIVQIGEAFYIFNWDNIRKTQKMIYFSCILNGEDTVGFPSNMLTIDKSYYTSDDTQISMADVYNKIKIECNLEEKDEIIPEPLDSDSLVSPFYNKNFYMYGREKIDYEDSWHTSDPYKYSFQFQDNPNWTFRYYHDGAVDEVKSGIEYDGNGTAIHQYGIAMHVANYKLCPCLCTFGKLKLNEDDWDPETNPDGEIHWNGTGTADTENYLIFNIKGSENKDADRTTEWNNIAKTVESYGGLVEYNSTTSAGVLTPPDTNTTNYIVFSGKISLQPPSYGSVNRDGDWSPECLRQYYTATYPSESGSLEGKSQHNTTKMSGNIQRILQPYFGWSELGSKYAEYYQEWFYQATDDVKKVPLLNCELKIGDKYCVETAENKFEWLTESECTSRGLEKIFTLGFKPSKGDHLLCKEWDITSDVYDIMNIDTDGCCIPINKSDKLSGKITFRIISPSYIGYEQYVYKHATWLRGSSSWNTSLPLMEFVDFMYIKDFKCKLYSNNGGSNAATDKDLVYVTDVINTSQQEKDITFKFNTALSTSEALEKGINTLPKLSNVEYLPNATTLGSITNNITGEYYKAEEMYIQDYYKEYSVPKLMVSTSLDEDKTTYWNKYQFSYFKNKVFYVVGTEKNLKYESTTYNLKEK